MIKDRWQMMGDALFYLGMLWSLTSVVLPDTSKPRLGCPCGCGPATGASRGE